MTYLAAGPGTGVEDKACAGERPVGCPAAPAAYPASR
jgi:hypothetical protein